MCQDIEFRKKYEMYVISFQMSFGKDSLLYFLNSLLNQINSQVPEIMRRNKDFVRIYTRHYGIGGIEWIDKDLREDREIMTNVIKLDGHLEWVNEVWRRDKDFLLDVLAYKAEIFVTIDEDLRKDVEFALEAIKRNESVFGYLDDEMKLDRGFVLRAVEMEEGIWDDIEEGLKQDEGFVREAMGLNYKIIMWDDVWDRHGDVVGRMVEGSQEMVDYLIEDCEVDIDAILFFDKVCRINPRILLSVVRWRGIRVLMYVDRSFGKNEELVLELLRLSSRYCAEYYKIVIDYIDVRLKTDVGFLRKAMRLRGDVWMEVLGGNLMGVEHERAEWRLG